MGIHEETKRGGGVYIQIFVDGPKALVHLLLFIDSYQPVSTFPDGTKKYDPVGVCDLFKAKKDVYVESLHRIF